MKKTAWSFPILKLFCTFADCNFRRDAVKLFENMMLTEAEPVASKQETN